jgi:hypothetical protein
MSVRKALALSFFLIASVALALPPDALVIVGAGYQPPWDTDLELANGQENELAVLVSQVPYSLTPCLSCPEWPVSLPARGTAKATAQQALTAGGAGGPAIRTLYVSGSILPTVTARIVNRDRPTQTIELPVVRRSTIEALNPTVMAFPSASRLPDSHSNLVLSEVSWEEGRTLSLLVEAYSPAGDRLGSAAFDLSTGRTLFLVDVLNQLGVSALDNGQIRVTKTGGTGLMWGLLATVSDDGRVSVSPGLNP